MPTFKKKQNGLLNENVQLREDDLRVRLKLTAEVWKEENSDIALDETNRQLVSQRLELYQADQWPDQAQREKICLFGKLITRNRFYQESRAQDGQEIEELRRICCEQADRARQLRIDELSMHQKENPSAVNQLLDQIQDFHDKVNFLNDAREFSILKQRTAAILVCRTTHGTQRVPQETFLGVYLLKKGRPQLTENAKNLASSSCGLRPGNTRNAMKHGEGVRREPQSSALPTPRFSRNYDAWTPLYHYGGTCSQNGMMEYPSAKYTEIRKGNH